MATSKATSTISYNTLAFLRERLDDWYRAHLIQAYMCIAHKGEDGDKDHIHLRIEPNKKLDVMDLTADLTEYVQGETKPRVVRPWRPSKEEDWILYVLHDPDYMRLKYGELPQGEKIPYEWTDIIASEGFDVETAYIRARQMLQHTPAFMVKRIAEGEKPLDMVSKGENVFTVNAIQRLMGTNDYQRTQEELAQWIRMYNELEQAIMAQGYDVVRDDDGHVILMTEWQGVAPRTQAVDCDIPEQWREGGSYASQEQASAVLDAARKDTED